MLFITETTYIISSSSETMSIASLKSLTIHSAMFQLLIKGASRIAKPIQSFYTVLQRMPFSDKCCQCLNAFSKAKLPRKLPNCSHSICEPCLRQIIDAKQDIMICGFCSSVLKKKEIRVFPINTAIVTLMNEIQPIDQSPAHEEENQLLSDINTGELCPAHKVVMDIICISDKHRICPHCALFGNHKDHRFKRLDDFEKQVKEKKKEFAQIKVQKDSMMGCDEFKIYDKMKEKVHQRRKQLLRDVEQESKRYVEAIGEAKKRAIIQVEQACKSLEEYFSSITSVVKFEKSLLKMQKWEKTCISVMEYLDHTPNVEERVFSYYEGPLQIVTQGLVFIDELFKYRQQAIVKLSQQLQELQFSKQSAQIIFEKCFSLNKSGLSPNNSALKSTDEQISQINPFMDCTSSQITLGQISILSSINIDGGVSTTMVEKLNENSSRAILTAKRQMNKSFRSNQKDKQRDIAKASKLNNQSMSARLSTAAFKRNISEVASTKFSPRLVKTNTLQETIPQTQEVKHELKEPEKLYNQFTKNTLSDFFDIADCNLSSDSVVEYVHRAKRIHKIRGLKLCNNKLTLGGFQKLTEFLHGVSNINMANNMISQGIFDLIIKNRDKLQSLRVINISHNPITFDKKAIAKMEQVKKIGIIIVL